MDITIAKKIEYAEISAIAHGWTHAHLYQFRDMHQKGSDSNAQKEYLNRLLAAIDAYRSGTSIKDILHYPDSAGIAT